MTTNLIFLLLAGVFLTAYCWVYSAKNGVPKSISDTFYHIRQEMRWTFTFTVGFSGLTLIVCGWNLMGDVSVIPWMPIGGAVLTFVPAAANVRYKKVSWLHYFGAFGGYGMAGISFWLSYGIWEWSAGMALSAIIVPLLWKNNKIFWVEVFLAVELLVGIALITLIKL